MRRLMRILRSSNLIHFLCGFVTASTLFLVFFITTLSSNNYDKSKLIQHYEKEFKTTTPIQKNESHSENKLDDNEKIIGQKYDYDTNEISNTLSSNVKVFCMITTMWRSEAKFLAVNSTWGPRCNKYAFFSSNISRTDVPRVNLPNITEHRKYLWSKTKAGLEWIYQNEIDEYDWFVKADDDTYFFMDNLRLMLLSYDPSEPLIFGNRLKYGKKLSFMSGGAGYVLSRAALKRFIEDFDQKKCDNGTVGNEDVLLAKCLKNIGVTFADSRDIEGRHRMLPFSPLMHSWTNKSVHFLPWFKRNTFYPYTPGVNCCSDNMISFHYLDHELMYSLDTLMYRIHPISVTGFSQYEPKSKTTLVDALRKLSLRISRPINSSRIT